MHIDVMDGGEFHIGSPECRYKGKLDIEMFGTRAEQIEHENIVLDKEKFCDHGFCGDIKKAVLVQHGGLLEIHGAEKKSWTYLADHLFKNNQPVPYQELSFECLLPAFSRVYTLVISEELI